MCEGEGEKEREREREGGRETDRESDRKTKHSESVHDYYVACVHSQVALPTSIVPSCVHTHLYILGQW